MKKIRLILIVALAVSTIMGSLWTFGVIRVRAASSAPVDPHQAIVEICTSKPQVQQQNNGDPVPCLGGSDNAGTSLGPDVLAYSWGIDCNRILPAGATDPCTSGAPTSIAITIAWQNPNFNPNDPATQLQVRVDDGLPVFDNFGPPQVLFCHGVTSAPNCPATSATPIIPAGTTQGVFTIIDFDAIVLAGGVHGAPSAATPARIYFLDITIAQGSNINFDDITAILTWT